MKVAERAVQKAFLTVALKADTKVVSWDVTWDDMRAAPLVDVMVWMLVGVLVASKDTQKADW